MLPGNSVRSDQSKTLKSSSESTTSITLIALLFVLNLKTLGIKNWLKLAYTQELRGRHIVAHSCEGRSRTEGFC